MPTRVLVKAKDLPEEVFETPEWLPSERKQKNGKNKGVLAFMQTIILALHFEQNFKFS